MQIATYKLPKRFFLFWKKDKPHMHIESVLAAIFLWQRGKVMMAILFRHKPVYENLCFPSGFSP